MIKSRDRELRNMRMVLNTKDTFMREKRMVLEDSNWLMAATTLANLKTTTFMDKVSIFGNINATKDNGRIPR
jgi:hypothetical protein